MSAPVAARVEMGLAAKEKEKATDSSRVSIRRAGCVEEFTIIIRSNFSRDERTGASNMKRGQRTENSKFQIPNSKEAPTKRQTTNGHESTRIRILNSVSAVYSCAFVSIRGSKKERPASWGLV